MGTSRNLDRLERRLARLHRGRRRLSSVWELCATQAPLLGLSPARLFGAAALGFDPTDQDAPADATWADPDAPIDAVTRAVQAFLDAAVPPGARAIAEQAVVRTPYPPPDPRAGDLLDTLLHADLPWPSGGRTPQQVWETLVYLVALAAWYAKYGDGSDP